MENIGRRTVRHNFLISHQSARLNYIKLYGIINLVVLLFFLRKSVVYVQASSTSVQQILNENSAITLNSELLTQKTTILPLISTASITHKGVSGTASWDIDSDGKLTIHAGILAYGPGNWSSYANSVTSVYVEEGVSVNKDFTTANGNNGVFSNLPNVKTIDVGNLDVTNASTLGNMFSGDGKLTQIIGLENWDTSACTWMNNMFYHNSLLTDLDISKFDTSRVESMNSMFDNCKSLTALDVSGFDTSNVEYIQYAFNGVVGKITGLAGFKLRKVTDLSYTLSGVDFTKTNPDDIKDWDVAEVTSMRGLFKDTKFDSLDLSKWDTSQLTDMSYMFANTNNVSKIKGLADWNISNVTNLSNTFSGVGDDNLDLVRDWNVSNVTALSSTFSDCSNLKSLDLSNWKVDNVKTTSRMFSNDKLLNENTLIGYQALVTNKNTDISWMFSNTGFKVIDLSKYDTSNVINMSYLFYNTSKLEKIIGDFDTRNVTNLSDMFESSTVTDLSQLNINNWDTSKVTDLSRTFANSKLTDYDFLKNWDVSNVRSLNSTFWNNTAVTSLPIGNWDVSNVTTMYYLFYSTTKLNDLNIENWNVSNVQNMNSTFFKASSLNSLNLSKWNTSKVTTFYAMFNSMTSLGKLDISGFDTTNATDVQYLFGGDTNLWKITLGPKSVLTNLKGNAQPVTVRLLDPVVGTVIQDGSLDQKYSAISDRWQEVGVDIGGTDHEPVGDLISANEIIDKYSAVDNQVTTYVWQQQYKIDMSLNVPDVDFGTTNSMSNIVKRKTDFDITVVNKNYPESPVPSTIKVAMQRPLTDTNDSLKTLNNVLIFKGNDNKEKILSATDTEIYSDDIVGGSTTLSWDDTHGLLLNMNNDKYAASGHYTTTLDWTLTNSL